MAMTSAVGRRPRWLVPAVAALFVFLVVGGVFVTLYTDLLWFREVGFSGVFTTRLRTRLVLFTLFGLAMAAIVGANLMIAHRLRPPFRPMSLEQQNLDRYRLVVQPYLRPALIVIAGIFGVLAGLSASARWQVWLLWRNAVPFGVDDPQFGRDVSFYTFSYPFQRMVVGFLFTALVLSLIVSAVTHYLFGGIRLQTQGEKVIAPARAHLSVLLGLIVLLKAWTYYFLDRFGLNFSSRGRVTGAAYADVNAELPALNILAVISVICAGLFFANVRSRGWALPATGLVLLVLSAVLIGGIYPAAIQTLRVNPTEAEREEPFIARNIENTRRAYQLDGAETTPFAAKPAPAAGAIRADKGSIPNARLLDPNVLQPTFEQLQQIRGYYGFPTTLDVDRYTVNGKTQDYLVAVRGLDQTQLAPNQRNWTNTVLNFTHGFGLVAVPGNAVNADGEPNFAIKNIPPETPPDIRIDQPRIYYGEQAPAYSVVGSDQKEIDRPSQTGDGNEQFEYDGKGGVSIGSRLRRLAYAIRFRDKNLVLSGALTERSRLLYVRDPKTRVQRVAPYLELDSDPYPAVVDGRILWIVDGYTVSGRYPYSELRDFGAITTDSRGNVQPPRQINYIRNSVKATVDAYDGTVTLYAWDGDDPVLRTWGKAFPGSLRPRGEMSPDLLAHVRYPEDFFKVQRELLAKYHVTDARAFYSEEDFWDVPGDPASDPQTGVRKQPPYYLFTQLPGASEPAFTLTSPMVARMRQNMAAYISVSNDGADYGKIRVLVLPRDTVIQGPEQRGATFKSDTTAARELTLLGQTGSRTLFGNLLTLPVGDSLVYVQPVYVQSEAGAQIPLLKKVLVGAGNRVGFADTFAQALEQIYGAGAGGTVTPPPGGGPPTPPPPGGVADPAALAQAIADANRAFADGQEALKRGDFAAYGEAQRRLQEALARAAAASGTPPPSPAPASPSPAPPPASPASAPGG